MKYIYLIVGPSGSGKSTIVDTLSRLYNYKVVQSYTERPRRYDDETGHIFVTRGEFDKLGPLCAYTLFNGYRYGVPDSMVDECDLYVIDPAGVSFMRKMYKGCKIIKVIGIDCSEDTCKIRMQQRGDSDEQIEQRLQFDKEAFKELYEISDVVILNASLDTTIDSIHNYIEECEKS